MRRGVPSKGAWLPLRFPLVEATKVAKDHVSRRMLVIPTERLADKEFYFVPLWHVEADVPFGRKGGRVARQLYVNAVSGHIAHVISGTLSFEAFPHEEVARLAPLALKAHLESGPAGKVGDPVRLARVGPSHAREIVHRALGARILGAEPTLCLLPVWKFRLESEADGKARTLWVDGTLGSVMNEAPEAP